MKVLQFDPRTKIILLILCVLTATMSPSLTYECVLVFLITVFGCLSGRIKKSLTGGVFFVLFYCFSLYMISLKTGTLYTMFVAWMGLFFKVYPCGMMAGIILSTTRINEFLSAMNKAHVPQKIIIPLAIMIRYIPTVREDWHYIKDAMRLRDVSLSLKGLFTNPGMTIECLYVPLMMTASKAADELTIASVTRGIENPSLRSCLIDIRFRVQDFLVLLLFLVLFAAGRFI